MNYPVCIASILTHNWWCIEVSWWLEVWVEKDPKRGQKSLRCGHNEGT